MAGFDDFLKAIQFGTGLVAGFASQSEQIRQKNAQEQLQLLQLLQKDEVSRLVPIPAEQIEQSGDFLTTLFGGGRARVTGTGEPATVFGGQGFALREYPPITIPPELLQPTPAPSAPAAAPTGLAPTPVRPFLAPQKAPGAVPTAPVKPQAQYGPLDTMVVQTAEKYGVDPNLALAIKGTEGSGVAAISHKGARGTFQILPGTAKPYGVSAGDLLKPGVNIDTAARHIADLQAKFPDRPDLVAAAYFSGEGNVKDGKIVNPDLHDGTPDRPGMTVREYVDKTMQRYTALSGQTPKGLVAGPGAVAARGASEAPTPPTFQIPELSLSQAPTEEDYTREAERSVYGTLGKRLRQTPKGEERLGVALKEARKEAGEKYNRDLKFARDESRRIKQERQVHDFTALNALDRATHPIHIKEILEYLDKHPNPDHLGDVVAQLEQLPPEQRALRAAQLYPHLVQANYAERQIEYALSKVLPTTEMQNLKERQKVEKEEKAQGITQARAELKKGNKAAAYDILSIYGFTTTTVPEDIRQDFLAGEAQVRLEGQQKARYEEQTALVNTIVANPKIYHIVDIPAATKAQILPRLIAGGVTHDDLYDPAKKEREELELKTKRFELNEKVRKAEGRFTPAEKAESLKELRGLLLREPIFRQYSETLQGYVTINAGAKLNNGAGDVAMINGAVKIFDPTGVVRPSEYLTVEQAQGVLQVLGKLPDRFMQGDRLHPDARRDFLRLAEDIMRGRLRVLRSQLENTYKHMAEPLGLQFDTLLNAEPIMSPKDQHDENLRRKNQERITFPEPAQQAPGQQAPGQQPPVKISPRDYLFRSTTP